MTFFTSDFLQFFIDLAANNNKEWFDTNRKRYEQNVKDPFKDFVGHIIKRISEDNPVFKGLEAKECIFRINRDIRFSKDKTPYKTMVSAVVAPEGKKSKAINGVYFELGPERLRIYGGIYEIDKEDLELVRERIAENIREFQTLYQAPDFVSTYGKIVGEKNKILPAHLKDAAKREDLIFNKQWYFYAEFPPERILSNDLDQLLLDCYETGLPVQKFLTHFTQ